MTNVLPILMVRTDSTDGPVGDSRIAGQAMCDDAFATD